MIVVLILSLPNGYVGSCPDGSTAAKAGYEWGSGRFLRRRAVRVGTQFTPSSLEVLSFVEVGKGPDLLTVATQFQPLFPKLPFVAGQSRLYGNDGSPHQAHHTAGSPVVWVI